MNGKTRLTIDPVAETVQDVDIRKQVGPEGRTALKGNWNCSINFAVFLKQPICFSSKQACDRYDSGGKSNALLDHTIR